MADGSTRFAGRVLLFDRAGRILLMRTAFADAGGVPHWLTPGGGADPGETPHDTAVRELFEETGLRVDDLGPLVASFDFDVNRPGARHSHAHWDFFQHVVDEPFEPSQDGWTDDERVDITGAHWWTLSELIASGEAYSPRILPRLIAEHRPIDHAALIAEIGTQPLIDVGTFTNDDAVDLGLIAVRVIRERRLDLAVRVTLHGDVAFAAKSDGTGPANDEWLSVKAAAAERMGEPSLLLRLRAEAAGTTFAEQHPELDPEVYRAYGGALPIRAGGEVVGTIAASGQPDAVDHAAVTEAVRQYLAARGR